MLELSTENGVRRATMALGVATTLFGLVPVVAPRVFARAFGIPAGRDPASSTTIRSVGLRDVVTGVGLCSAALHGGRLPPWLLTRLLVDAGDAAVVALALASGSRDRRLGTLGILASGAAAIDALLWQAARRVTSDE